MQRLVLLLKNAKSNHFPVVQDLYVVKSIHALVFKLFLFFFKQCLNGDLRPGHEAIKRSLEGFHCLLHCLLRLLQELSGGVQRLGEQTDVLCRLCIASAVPLCVQFLNVFLIKVKGLCHLIRRESFSKHLLDLVLLHLLQMTHNASGAHGPCRVVPQPLPGRCWVVVRNQLSVKLRLVCGLSS